MRASTSNPTKTLRRIWLFPASITLPENSASRPVPIGSSPTGVTGQRQKSFQCSDASYRALCDERLAPGRCRHGQLHERQDLGLSRLDESEPQLLDSLFQVNSRLKGQQLLAHFAVVVPKDSQSLLTLL